MIDYLKVLFLGATILVAVSHWSCELRAEPDCRAGHCGASDWPDVDDLFALLPAETVPLPEPRIPLVLTEESRFEYDLALRRSIDLRDEALAEPNFAGHLRVVPIIFGLDGSHLYVFIDLLTGRIVATVEVTFGAPPNPALFRLDSQLFVILGYFELHTLDWNVGRAPLVEYYVWMEDELVRQPEPVPDPFPVK